MNTKKYIVGLAIIGNLATATVIRAQLAPIYINGDNVGIGVTNPSTRLSVSIDSGSDAPQALFTNTNVCGGAGIILNRTHPARAAQLIFSTNSETNWNVGILRRGGSPT